MNVDDEKTTTQDVGTGTGTTDGNEYASSTTNYKVMSRSQKEKDRYIQKEQLYREKMLAQENRNVFMTYPHYRMPSLGSVQSTVTDTDYNDIEWTPEDSSYGAAFPFCGWLPKSLRQALEKALIALTGLLIIYAIVSIAILLTGDGEKKNGKTSTYNYDDFYSIDDDFYVRDQWNVDDNDDADDYMR